MVVKRRSMISNTSIIINDITWWSGWLSLSLAQPRIAPHPFSCFSPRVGVRLHNGTGGGIARPINLRAMLSGRSRGERPYGLEFLGILLLDLMNRKGILQIQPELLGSSEIFG